MSHEGRSYVAIRRCRNCNASLLPGAEHCPWCGAPTPLIGPTPRAQSGAQPAPADMVGRTCPYCQTAIAAGDSTVVCSACGTPHHADCWRENARCTTFGCQGGPGGRALPAQTGPVDITVPRGPYRSPDPYASSPTPGYPYLGLKPHRGGTIVTYGILGIFCCFLFGISAWVMGNEDLHAMDLGIMDGAGRATTETGRVLGIVGTCLGGGLLLLRVLAALANS